MRYLIDTNTCIAVMRNHANATVYLDKASSSLLSPATLAAFAAAA